MVIWRYWWQSETPVFSQFGTDQQPLPQGVVLVRGSSSSPPNQLKPARHGESKTAVWGKSGPQVSSRLQGLGSRRNVRVPAERGSEGLGGYFQRWVICPVVPDMYVWKSGVYFGKSLFSIFTTIFNRSQSEQITLRSIDSINART